MPPDKIALALQNLLGAEERPLITFKTAWKPRFGTPTLWVSATSVRLLIFSTLRGGTLYTEAKFSQINAVVAEQSGRLIKVLFWNPQTEDLSFNVGASVTTDEVNKLLDQIRTRLSDKAASDEGK